MHDDFLHKKIESGDSYPQPEVPVEKAWDKMSALLNGPLQRVSGKAAVQTSIRRIFFFAGIGLSAVLIVILVSLSRTAKHGPKGIVVYHAGSVSVTDTINGVIASLDRNSSMEKIATQDDAFILKITGAAYLQKDTAKKKNDQAIAGPLTVIMHSGNIYLSFDTATQTSLIQVQSGIAEINTGGHNLHLKAGESVNYNLLTRKTVYSQTIDPNLFSYATRVFDFKDLPLKEATEHLEKAYGVTFVFQNTDLYRCRITTRFDNKSLDEIMNIMAYTLGFEYNMDPQKRIVFISGKGCD